MTTGVANAQAFGATGDGVTDDTVALQAALDYCFGSAASPHGTNYYQNKVLYIPPGHYKTTAPLLITDLQGGAIWGAGRFTTLIENVTGGSGTGDVIRTNGMGYSSITDMAFVCHEDGICLDLDYDGSGGGAALQANTIENVICGGGSEDGTIGARVGFSNFMGSEFIFKMFHTQGCAVAGTMICNFNALQHQFYGGQDQACGVGIWAVVGSAPVINGRAFQQQTVCDIKTSGAYLNTMSIAGCRTESPNFILNEGGQTLDISGCLQTTGLPDHFLVSNGGLVSMRSCITDAAVNPVYWCNLTIESCRIAGGLELDPALLWWVPNNDVAANVHIRNSIITESAVENHIINQRRCTTNGSTITTTNADFS